MATVTHNIPRGLFHVSEVNHNGKVFRPRIPHSAEESENMDIKRICFSTSITGASDANLFIPMPRVAAATFFAASPLQTAKLCSPLRAELLKLSKVI